MDGNNGITILVVTADQLVSAGIVTIVNRCEDMRVLAAASNHTDTISKIGEMRPSVVILDAELPAVNPAEISKRIKSIQPEIRILLLVTERLAKSCLVQTLQAGVGGYVSKTTTEVHLLTAIRAVHSGEGVMCPRLVYEIAKELDYLGTITSSEKDLGPPTEREVEIIKLAAQGLTNRKIAKQLFISERTVQSHLAAVFKRFGVESRTQAVLSALRNGWITYDSIT
ncbi:MAG: response regulator transcription factor [Chloroflexi bacterium]|nr:response regulator transcription factor [Chloroflexota bacterium]